MHRRTAGFCPQLKQRWRLPFGEMRTGETSDLDGEDRGAESSGLSGSDSTAIMTVGPCSDLASIALLHD